MIRSMEEDVSSRGSRSESGVAGRFRSRRQDEDVGWIDPYRNAVKRELVFCHFCGYGPPRIPADGVCPKCGRDGWEHSIVSLRLLPAEDDR